MDDIRENFSSPPPASSPDDDFFQSFMDESREAIGDILSEESSPQSEPLKLAIMIGVSVIIVVFSFWGSFTLGKRLFNNNRSRRTLRSDILLPQAQQTVSPEPTHPISDQPVQKVKQTRQTSLGTVAVVAGSFRYQASVQRMVKTLNAKGFQPDVQKIDIKGQPMYRVLIGTGLSREDAQALQATAKTHGYDTFLLQQ